MCKEVNETVEDCTFLLVSLIIVILIATFLVNVIQPYVGHNNVIQPYVGHNFATIIDADLQFGCLFSFMGACFAGSFFSLIAYCQR